MTERDWLGELVRAVGEDPDRPEPLASLDDPREPQGEGTGGTDVDGWTRQLAMAFGKDVPGPSPVVLPVADARARTAGELSFEARLARVESLLAADLEALGPAVLADSVARLADELDSLQQRVAAMPASAAGVVDDGGVSLRHLVTKLDDRVLAQSQFLLHQEDVRTDLAAAITVVSERLDLLAERLDLLAEWLEHRFDALGGPALEPGPSGVGRRSDAVVQRHGGSG